MIRIEDKKNCVGCSACLEICPKKAIVMETDREGFQYPIVDLKLCIDCGLCEKTCPVLHFEELKINQLESPDVFAVQHKNFNIRSVSTSGGAFSAFADIMYKENGYVCGAVYTENFDVRHIVSNIPVDLQKIRGSKHIQSDFSGVFKQVRNLLSQGEKVLVCAAPCQIAGLKLFLGKDFENLILIDFICAGINSPKIFHKYLENLEKKKGAEVVSIQAKNKDLGWRSLAYKIDFANNKTYLKAGKDDVFTRGFIQIRCNSRPACYSCKFKGFPRFSDLSLGDFWGIEKVDSGIDDNMGTSVVLLNSAKGVHYFENAKDSFIYAKKSIEDVLPGNPALVRPLPPPTIERDEFYKDIDDLSFNKIEKKYFRKKSKMERVFGGVKKLYKMTVLRPFPLLQLCKINFCRKNTHPNVKRGYLIFPTSHTVFDVDKSAKIDLNGRMFFGYKRVRGARLESTLLLEKNSVLTIRKGHVNVYYGADIQLFKDAKLTFNGSVTLNKGVQIICMNEINIGDDVLISRDVVIRDNDGGHKILTEGYKPTAPVTIGNHVWIGHGAMIMKGVTIGDGSIIGAGAWVVTNVKPNSVVMGDPARTVQKNVIWQS